MDLRTLLAAALGLLLGAVMLVFPDAIIRAYLVGRVPTDRYGSYGDDNALPTRWRRLVQAVGILVLGGGLYFAWQLV